MYCTGYLVAPTTLLQIVQLKNAGVSQNVIDHMISTGR